MAFLKRRRKRLEKQMAGRTVRRQRWACHPVSKAPCVDRAAPRSFRATDSPELDLWRLSAVRPKEDSTHGDQPSCRIQVRGFQATQALGRDSRPHSPWEEIPRRGST